MQQQALHRHWQALITARVGVPPILVNDPLTVEFNYRKNITGQLNQGSFRIYNLNQETRRQIEFDRFQTQNASSVGEQATLPNQLYLPFSFSEGLAPSALTLAFEGNIQKAYSTKQGVDIITQIDCVDGMYGVNNSFDKVVVDSPITTTEVLTMLFGSMKNLQKGFVSDLPSVELPFFSFNGRVFDKMRQLANGGGNSSLTCGDCFIDNGKINILATNEAFIDNGVLVFNADSIIGSPRATGGYIEFDIVLTSELQLAQIIELQTSINSFINGQYKVVGLSGQGTLGDSKVGQNITTVQVFRPIDGNLVPVYSGT
jgi:hypothetical protein